MVLLAGCEGESNPQAQLSSPSAQESLEPWERLPRVRPPALQTQLTPEKIQRCLYKEQIDLDAIASLYFGPEDLVAGQVETSRELEFDAPSSELLGPKEFAKSLGGLDINVGQDDEAATKGLAWALGVTSHGDDVNQFLKGEGSGLVAGFYDPRNGRIVIEQKGKLDSEYVVMAHEFTHAATDQAFGLPATKPEAVVDDLTLSISSLVEGDAGLTELRVLSRLAPPKSVEKSIAAQIAFKDKFAKDRGAGIPYLVIDNALFPYRWGLSFACTVFKKEGWRGINRAYARLPTTSAQILFPERFLAREKALPTSPLHKPGPIWQLRDTGQIGAAHLKALFEAPGDKEFESLSRTLSRASSWGGGVFKIWTVGDVANKYVVGLSLTEHPDHDDLLCSSMNEWYRAAFPDAEVRLVGDRVVQFTAILQDAIMSCPGDNVIMGLGPNLQLVREVLDISEA